MAAGSTGRDGVDPAEQLTDEIVSYWEGETLVVQTGLGELIVATDTLARVER